MRYGWALVVALAGLLVVPPAIPAQAGGELPEIKDEFTVAEDGTGDLSPLGPGVVPSVPTTPAHAHVDLRKATIANEDELGLVLSLYVEELRVGNAAALGFAATRYEASFGLDGTSYNYALYLTVYGASPSPDTESFFVAQFYWGYLCLQSGEFGCLYQPVEVALDDAANAIRIWIPKASLMGVYGGAGGGGHEEGLPQPPSIAAGMQLTNFEFSSYSDDSFFICVLVCGVTQMYDQAPDAGDAQPYTLKTGAANAVVSLFFHEDDGSVSVEAGKNQSVAFSAMNYAAGKRILKLQYVLEGPSEATALYKVTGPPTIQVPGGQVRNFTLALDVEAGASAADGVRLTIRAESVGHPEEIGVAIAELLPGAALGPTSNTLYFHARSQSIFGDPLDLVFCPTALIPCHFGWMSPLREEPGENADGRIEAWGFPSGPGAYVEEFSIGLNQDLPGALAFNLDGTIDVELKLQASFDSPGVRARVILVYGFEDDSGRFFEGELFSEGATVTIPQAGTVLKLSGPVRLNGFNIMPPGAYMYLRVELASNLQPGGQANYALGGTVMQGKESFIRLPLTELPEEYKLQSLPSPFQLSVVGEREEFVNPGEARLYNVTVLNQGVEPHRLTLAATIEGTGWGAEVQPGTVYDLEPGDTIQVGVLVHAPADAQEGEVGIARLNATDQSGAIALVKLTTTATNGVDLPNDALSFEADAEAQAKLADDDDGGKSPGLGFVAQLGALAAVGLALLRRRRA